MYTLSNTDTSANDNNSNNTNNGGQQQQQGQQSSGTDGPKEGQMTYSMLLKTELLGMSASTSRSSLDVSGSYNFSQSQGSQSSGNGGTNPTGAMQGGQVRWLRVFEASGRIIRIVLFIRLSRDVGN